MEKFEGRKRGKSLAQHRCKVVALERIKKPLTWQERGREHCAGRHEEKG